MDLCGMFLVMYSCPIPDVSRKLQRSAWMDSGTVSSQDSYVWEWRGQLCTDVLESKHCILCDQDSVCTIDLGLLCRYLGCRLST